MPFSPIEVSAADMKAAFTVKTIPPIPGRPNLFELLRLLKHVCRNSQTTKSCLGPLGYLFVALPQMHYARFTAVPLVIPAPTPNLPNFIDGMNSGQREQVRLNWTAHKAENNNIANMNEALTSVFLEAIGDTYKKHLDNDLVGRVTSNFWQIFTTFLNKYGKIKPMDLENNLIRMKKDWDPSSPIEDLFAQINDANEYSIFAQHPYGVRDLVQAGEVVILRTNMFASEYKDWRTVDMADRTWNNFQDWWQEAYDLKEETETTAASMGYGNSAQQAAEQERHANDEATYEASVHNFGTAFAANSKAFANLSEANQEMGTNMAANVQNIQAQINDLTNLMHSMNAAGATRPQQPYQYQQFAPPPQQQYVPQQRYTTNPPPPAQYNSQFQAPAPFQQNQQPPQTPYANNNSYRGRGRRNRGGRNGGSGRDNAYFGQGYTQGRGAFVPHQQQPPPHQQQNNRWQQPMQNMPFSNTTKRYANYNYCWSHGHDIKEPHHSGNCPNPTLGHVWTATKQNPAGGSNKNAHKTSLPVPRQQTQSQQTQQQQPYY